MSKALSSDVNATKGHTMKITNGEKSPFTFSKSSQSFCDGHQRINERFVGLVGPVGAGTSVVATVLQHKFEQNGFDVKLIKASHLIRSITVPTSIGIRRLDPAISGGMYKIHHWGNDIRRGVYKNNIEDHAAIARLVLQYIMRSRDQRIGQNGIRGSISSNSKPIVYIIDSIRNSAESEVFRRVYRDSFFLLGVVCDATVREERIRRKLEQSCERYEPHTASLLREILENDKNSTLQYGQQVADTVLAADYFIDNAEDWGNNLTDLKMYIELDRFVDWVIGRNNLSVTIAEEAMFEAYKASLKSTNHKNQIGASLIDADNQFIGFGSSDVPSRGDKLFNNLFNTEKDANGRCVFCNNPSFFDIIEHDQMIEEIVEKVVNMSNEVDAGELHHIIRGVLLKHKLEFSRIIHAEIDAIISAIRSGNSTIGCKMFVTGFPCQSCIGYIESAGINEVIYLDPYPTVEIFNQFKDSITSTQKGWIPPSSMRLIYSSDVANQTKDSKMLFQPYVGIAPKRFAEVFLSHDHNSSEMTNQFVAIDSGLTSDMDEMEEQTYYAREQEFSQSQSMCR